MSSNKAATFRTYDLYESQYISQKEVEDDEDSSLKKMNKFVSTLNRLNYYSSKLLILKQGNIRQLNTKDIIVCLLNHTYTLMSYLMNHKRTE